MACPGNETVLRFVAGRLDHGAATVVRRHLDSCDACRALVDDLAQGDRPPPGPAPGEIISGKYRVEQTIGTGGMGVVVAATHLELGRRVAIKVMHASLGSDPQAAKRLVREARAAAAIESVNAVHIYDVDRLPSGRPYIVMELLEGRDLGAIVKDTGPLSIADATSYVLDACSALAEAHKRGIVHRDVKPANVFLTNKYVVKVLDFGLAKQIASAPPPSASELTLKGTTVGSPFWMSPEQLRSGPVDERTDVWGIGATLYFLLSGVPPFAATQLVVLTARILSEAPTPITRYDLPPSVEEIVFRCLAKDPAGRFATTAELSKALRAARGAPASPLDADTSPMSRPLLDFEGGHLVTTRKRPARKR